MLTKVRIITIQLVLILICCAILVTDRAFALYSDVSIFNTSIKTAESSLNVDRLTARDEQWSTTQEIRIKEAVTITFDVANNTEDQVYCYGDLKLAFHDNSLLESNNFFIFPSYISEDEIYDIIENENGIGSLLGFNPLVSDFTTSAGIREGIYFSFCSGLVINAKSKLTFQYKLFFLDSDNIMANPEYYDNQPLEIVVSVKGSKDPSPSNKVKSEMYYVLNAKTSSHEDPVIILYGDNPYIMQANTSYEEPGFDAFSGDGSSLSVFITSNINSDRVGNYIVTYTTYDESGRGAVVERTVIVVDNPSPKIAAKEGALFELVVNDEHDLKSLVIATDYLGNDISDQIVVQTDDSYNSNVAGEYMVSYTVTDDFGMEAKPFESNIEVYDIEKISSSSTHSLIIGSNGKIYAFGTNDYGELGLGFYGSERNEPENVEFFNSINIVEVLAINNTSYALDDNGRIYCWGQGTEGELGHEMSEKHAIPMLVKRLLDEKVTSLVKIDEEIIATTDTGITYSSSKVEKDLVEQIIEETEVDQIEEITEEEKSEVEIDMEVGLAGHYSLSMAVKKGIIQKCEI